ncbi:MAG: hypothetical protein E3J69_04000 [Anaerolineales bacterium]|nr:MAG: hypothetical protein E3J69_04000 [Anaerolineales bacterium]
MATEDRTAEEAEQLLRDELEAAGSDSTEDVPAPSTPEEEKPEGFNVLKAKASEAIDHIRKCENVSEIYDLVQAEEKGKARTTVIQEGLARVQELNLLKEEAREQAQAVLETPDLTDSDPEPPETEAEAIEAVATPEVEEVEEVGEYPIEDVWDGEIGRYVEIKHISRTMHPMGGVDERIMSPVRLNEYLEEHFAKGFELIKVLPQGFGQDGVSILYVLGKVSSDLESKHTNIWHIQRTLTERPALSGGITGFQADKYLNSFLSEGWQLFAANALKEGEAEIPMLWVLVR